jgi:hypothetical protein
VPEVSLLALLQEQHEAMADVMMLRRPSSSPEQRAMADAAIAVWRKVQAFLSTKEPKMKTYIGIKQIEAEPCDESGFYPEKAFEATHTDPLAQGREGYRVRYPDGYVSWSPADVFEAAYVEVDPGEATLILGHLSTALLGFGSHPGASDEVPGFLPPPHGPDCYDRTGERRAQDLHMALDLAGKSGVPWTPDEVLRVAAKFTSFLEGLVVLDGQGQSASESLQETYQRLTGKPTEA